MKKKVHEQVWPTLLVSALGFGMLAIAVPEWARFEVVLFGMAFGGLVAIVDGDMRDALLRALDACLRRHDNVRRDDTKSAPAKAPASRRAAT